jgi:hypothetical protein
MPLDMPKMFEESKERLDKMLTEGSLSEREKGLVLAALNFAYSAGCCFKEQEMQGNGFRQQLYSDAYNEFRFLLQFE